MTACTALLSTSAVFAAGGTAKGGDGLPNPGVDFIKGQTAIVITDPQIDFLSPEGVSWGLVGKSVIANNTVENIDKLMKIAGEKNIPLIISPHFYAPTDLHFKHGGALEHAMHGIKMFESDERIDQAGFKPGTGPDWMPQYKKYINNGKTAVSTPHKVYGPDTNDTVLQLRKRNINKIILAGMSANLCTESHLREFMEQGFEVMVIKDATAAAQLPGLDGYAAAMTNVRMIANSVKSTEEVLKQINKEL
ncbi:cysteine hydrolase [Shewanella eurypsychrophilus]|uniref:Cysteine hydrolase n=2 Tax=Shewanellaceae TaxID=267890 RepID=A0ABX6VCM8_9GAMM|nr:isochorismatase family protein [Shewanella sp. YLB-09]QPG60476.1 cysteine hydrolase [Shewanella eurypsychrophilus]